MNSSLQVNLPRSWAAPSGSLQEKSEHSFFLFYYYRMEDEAVLDRGASFLKHVCDEEEVEGELHGSGEVYIFVHVFVDNSTHTFHYLVFLKLKSKSFYGVSLISTFCFNTESNFKNFIGPSESESKKRERGVSYFEAGTYVSCTSCEI